MSHTPGPWITQEVKGSFQVPFHIIAADGSPVAYCEGNQLRPDRASIGAARHNARLIAAAPDLLAACEELLIYLGDWDDPDNDTCVRAREAIAKARGVE